jgi:hypothetical protein
VERAWQLIDAQTSTLRHSESTVQRISERRESAKSCAIHVDFTSILKLLPRDSLCYCPCIEPTRPFMHAAFVGALPVSPQAASQPDKAALRHLRSHRRAQPTTLLSHHALTHLPPPTQHSAPITTLRSGYEHFTRSHLHNPALSLLLQHRFLTARPQLIFAPRPSLIPDDFI